MTPPEYVSGDMWIINPNEKVVGITRAGPRNIEGPCIVRVNELDTEPPSLSVQNLAGDRVYILDSTAENFPKAVQTIQVETE